jgi:hypothetical protein
MLAGLSLAGTCPFLGIRGMNRLFADDFSLFTFS